MSIFLLLLYAVFLKITFIKLVFSQFHISRGCIFFIEEFKGYLYNAKQIKANTPLSAAIQFTVTLYEQSSFT
jgi:hypothetical protein